MKIYEIHITGEQTINEELTQLGIKNIVIDLLTPNQEILRTEYMSSFVQKFETLDLCMEYVTDLIDKLKSKIIRVKVETPYYEEYVPISLYMESHFMPILNSNLYPISRNQRSQKLMATDRTYDKLMYDSFKTKWENEDVELCVYDDFIDEDKDWFEMYERNSHINLVISD